MGSVHPSAGFPGRANLDKSALTTVIARAVDPSLRFAAGDRIQGVVARPNQQGSLIVSTHRGDLRLKTSLSPPSGATVSLTISHIGRGSITVVVALDQGLPSRSVQKAGLGTGPGGKGSRPAIDSIRSPVAHTVPALFSGVIDQSQSRIGSELRAVSRFFSQISAMGGEKTSWLLQDAGADVSKGNPLPPVSFNGVRFDFRLVAVESHPDQANLKALWQQALRRGAGSQLMPGVIASSGDKTLHAGKGGTSPAPASPKGGGPTLFGSGASPRSSGSLASYILTPLGGLKLDTPIFLPVGAQLILDVMGMFGSRTEADLARGVSSYGRWPHLEMMLEMLAAHPKGATILETSFPQPGPRLASMLLLLMNALRGGDIRQWLGAEGYRILEAVAGHQSIERLREDFNRFSRILSHDNPDQWRVFLIPIQHGGRVHFMRWSIQHRQKGGTRDQSTDEPVRFVIDFTLSRLGDIQLDGFLHKNRFDLILRAQPDLPAPVRKDIRLIYQNARAMIGFRGDLEFQSGRHFVLPSVDDNPVRNRPDIRV